MESLRENKKLQYGLGLAYAVVWISVAEVFPPINDALEVSLPSSGVAVAVVIASIIAAAVAVAFVPATECFKSSTANPNRIERELLSLD